MYTQRRGSLLIRTVVWLAVIAAIVASIAILPRLQTTTAPARVVLITADNDQYWERLIDGAETAAELLEIDLTIVRADGSTDTQTDLIVNAVEQNFDAVAVSPVDANKQAVLLRSVGKTAPLVTVDSDCTLSGRICFVGANNYAAGRASGEMIKQAMPDGARVLIVMGPTAKDNGERRRQGIIDELLSRSNGPGRPTEPLDEVHGEGTPFVIAATVVDEIDPEQAQNNVREALESDPTINCVVGLFAYSAPAALAAVEELGRGDDVTVVGFDDRPESLDAIASGKMFGTIAQDQYSYGYHSVRVLADAVRGIESSIPVTEQINFAPVAVTSENLDQYRSDRAESSTPATTASNTEATPTE